MNVLSGKEQGIKNYSPLDEKERVKISDREKAPLVKRYRLNDQKKPEDQNKKV